MDQSTDPMKTEFLTITPELMNTGFSTEKHKYNFHQKISPKRWKKYLRLQPQLSFGRTFEEVFNLFFDAFTYINDGKMANAAVACYNGMQGIETLREGRKGEKEKHPIELQLCALFINYEGEDLTDITDDQIDLKIEDWCTRAIDMHSFFQLALAFIPTFVETYEQLSQIISEAKKKDASTN